MSVRSEPDEAPRPVIESLQRDIQLQYKGSFPSRYAKLERWIYLLHKIAGIGVGLFLIAHLYETSLVLNGESFWNSFMLSEETPLFHWGLLIIAAASVFHGLNGLRIFLASLGVGVGTPIRPAWPYAPVKSLGVQKKLLWLVIALTLLLTIYAFYQLIWIYKFIP
jgi:succinate dehydrogenase / fumarate reductase cytochrome b subunit